MFLFGHDRIHRFHHITDLQRIYYNVLQRIYLKLKHFRSLQRILPDTQ